MSAAPINYAPRTPPDKPDPLFDNQPFFIETMPAVYAEDPTLMTGEHVYPWMFEQMNTLAPLREAADLLAQHEWPRLYDRDMLADNEVPAAAAIYTDDMYVERTFSEETAAHVRGLRPWVTSEYEHNGLRADGGRILERLIDLVRGRR